MLAGLESITAGEISIGERVVNKIAPRERDIAMVFQDYALYPQWSVFDNLAFGLRRRKVPKADIERRVNEAASLLDLDPYLQRRPGQLSGGQAQRVALGRALVREPQVFLMDEPLSNLDAKLRVQMRADISQLQRELKVTTVYVTHDQVEAMTMGDRVAVLKDGVLQQADTPLNLYDKPQNLFVAGFIGSPAMNLLKAHNVDGHAKLGNLEIPIDRSAAAKGHGDITVGVRPESWRVVGENEGIPVKVTVVEELGADGFVYGTSGEEGTPEQVTIRIGGRRSHQKGETIHVTTDPEKVHVFETDTGERLSQ
jgi:multiple sugar transport system ATP-binding protein